MKKKNNSNIIYPKNDFKHFQVNKKKTCYLHCPAIDISEGGEKRGQKACSKVLPGFEPRSQESESRVITNYTIRPYVLIIADKNGNNIKHDF